jgi:hypothetical protein
MRRSVLLLSAFGVFNAIGCASWRQPVPTLPSVQASNDPAKVQANAVIIVPPTSTRTEVASSPLPSPAAAQSPNQVRTARTEVANTTPPVVLASATVVQKNEEVPVEQPADLLSLVSDSLDRGDKITAATHLETYVRQHPDQSMFRLQLAELFLQIDRDVIAKVHMERFVADAQTTKGPVHDYLVHAHTRLMEIAQRADDSFGELFHRGVGLLILVQDQDSKPDRDEDFCEEMLCKALRALNAAKEQNSEDPRVRVYLAEVYERMGNRRASSIERSSSRNRFVPGELTPGERSLILVRGS